MGVLARTASSRLRTWRAPHEDEAAGDRWRPAAGDLTRSIFRWRESDLALETRAERAEARETDEIADLGHREIHGAKELAGPLDPPGGAVRARRQPICVAERAG